MGAIYKDYWEKLGLECLSKCEDNPLLREILGQRKYQKLIGTIERLPRLYKEWAIRGKIYFFLPGFFGSEFWDNTVKFLNWEGEVAKEHLKYIVKSKTTKEIFKKTYEANFEILESMIPKQGVYNSLREFSRDIIKGTEKSLKYKPDELTSILLFEICFGRCLDARFAFTQVDILHEIHRYRLLDAKKTPKMIGRIRMDFRKIIPDDLYERICKPVINELESQHEREKKLIDFVINTSHPKNRPPDEWLNAFIFDFARYLHLYTGHYYWQRLANMLYYLFPKYIQTPEPQNIKKRFRYFEKKGREPIPGHLIPDSLQWQIRQMSKKRLNPEDDEGGEQ